MMKIEKAIVNIDEIIEDEDPTTCVERRARGECNFDLVVRCRDCKHYLGLAECDIEGVFCGGTNFYCAYGERKGENG